MNAFFSKRLRCAVVACVLGQNLAGARLYTVAEAFGEARSFAGPHQCFRGVTEGLGQVAEGRPFLEAFREFFIPSPGRSSSFQPAAPRVDVSDVDMACWGQFRLAARPAGFPEPVAAPLLHRGAALTGRLPQDLSPVVPFHLDSKK